MKKVIIFFLILYEIESVFSQKYFLDIEDKGYEAADSQHCNESNLHSIRRFCYEFDSNGYITNYTAKVRVNGKILTDDTVTVTYLNEDSRKVDYKCYYNSDEEKLSSFSRVYNFQNNSWVDSDNKDCFVRIVENKNRIEKFEQGKMVESFEYNAGAFIFTDGKSNSEIFTQKNGILQNRFDTQCYDCEIVESNYDSIGIFSTVNNKYVLETHFDGRTDIYTFKTNYDFKSWKAAAFNYSVNTWSYDFIPYVLGFGNGFEINKGEIYTGPYKSLIYSASSFLKEKKSSYGPENLEFADGLPWSSGNGYGTGDVITIKDYLNYSPGKITIMNGYQDENHPDYYEKNSRVKRIKFTSKNGNHTES